jgi:DNA mismatch repair protein MutS
MDKLLQSFQPSELILSKSQVKRFREFFDSKVYTFLVEEWIFREQYTYDLLLQHFQTQSLKGFGIEELRAAIIASGVVLHYIRDTEHSNLQHINSIQRITAGDFLWMDRFTIRNLELIHSSYEHGANLLNALDHTSTPMGARLLKRWLIFPLADPGRINHRLDMVQGLLLDQDLSQRLIQLVRQTGDVERLVAKIPLKKASPREVQQLARSFRLMTEVRDITVTCGNSSLAEVAGPLQPLTSLQQRILQTLVDEAPALAAKGGMIRQGVSADLDQLRNISRSGKDYLLRIQQSEAARTGISSLKVSYNNVFGYYLEVTHAHKDKVPAEWIRKQTLVNAERYITPELKAYEEQILGAEEKILALETRLFNALLLALMSYIKPVQLNAQLGAKLDVLLNFATIAIKNYYVKPQISDSRILDIKGGRHPVIEQNLPLGEEYITNDVYLDSETQQIIIICVWANWRTCPPLQNMYS